MPDLGTEAACQFGARALRRLAESGSGNANERQRSVLLPSPARGRHGSYRGVSCRQRAHAQQPGARLCTVVARSCEVAFLAHSLVAGISPARYWRGTSWRRVAGSPAMGKAPRSALPNGYSLLMSARSCECTPMDIIGWGCGVCAVIKNGVATPSGASTPLQSGRSRHGVGRHSENNFDPRSHWKRRHL